MWHLAGELGLQERCGALAELHGDRDAWTRRRLQGMPDSSEGYESHKQLILAVLNGKGLKQGWATELRRLHAECALVRQGLAQRFPEQLRQLQGLKRNPVVSLTSLHMMHWEREQVDRMIHAAGNHLVSVEHDGIVVNSEDCIEGLKAACEAKVSVKKYPASLQDILTLAAELYPGVDWTAKSRIPWKDVQRARLNCVKLLTSKPKSTAAAQTDFAAVVASRLEGTVVYAKSKIAIYDEQRCKWDLDCREIEVHGLVRTELHNAFKTVYLAQENFVPLWKIFGDAHYLLKSHGAITAIAGETKPFLVGALPEPGDMRRKLPFHNGFFYDFQLGKVVRAHRGLAPDRCMPWEYASWQLDAVTQKEFSDVVQELFTWEADHARDLQGTHGNEQLAACFLAVMQKIPGVAFTTRWFEADCLSYFLQHYCRMMAAEPKFFERLNIHGPPLSGKDALVALFEAHMGNVGEGGFAGGLMPEHVVLRHGTRSSNNGPLPFLHPIKGARSVIVPEMTKEPLNMDMLKALLEQEGAQITSRECYGNTTRWSPSALLVTIGNYCPNFGETPPDGTERRVNVLSMTKRFATQPDHEAQVLQGDFNLKTKIKRGEYFLDFFHVAAALYPFLQLYGNKIRRPTKVEEETIEALVPRGRDAAKPWHLELFSPAESAADAAIAAQVREAVIKELCRDRKQDANTELVNIGFQMDISVKGRPVCKFRFPGTTRASFVALRATGASSSSTAAP
jgi:hypothetical protein